MKVIFLLFYLVCVFLLNAAQLEEGWRWKKVFTIQLHEGEKQYSVDQLHTEMSKEVATLHGTFEKLVQNHASVIDPIRGFLNSNRSMHDVFGSLNTDDKTIDDIFTHEDPSGQLRNYWLHNIDFASPPENNEKIISIIRQNLQRLSTRNIVLATIGTTNMGEYFPIPLILKNKSSEYKRELDNYIAALHSKSYNKDVAHMTKKFRLLKMSSLRL